MARGFNVARIPQGDAPEVQSMPYTTGQTFTRGALVVTTAAGTVSECGADPAAVSGVALEGAGTKPGYDAANSPTVVTGRVQEVSVAKANRSTIFSARGVNGATDPVVPLTTHIGEQYGVAKVGNDWVIDFTETTDVVVQIVDIVPATEADVGFFLCRFLEDVLETP